MAERPLYTLYKNLKAQNYDVPDDYNKFESALTRDGKGGADNRHAIYENLKAQNFDVPSTYERFYSALFEPRSKTSSRAKGGSVPMSAADRARFSAGAAAISASAQQTMNNAGRYNRLKQRKHKQQKDFGRVNLGTNKTPYGGDANNVVKDDFAYNPETGKTGAYVTSDNENVYSLPEAEQMQAILDKQNDAYQVAVDTGEIPSAFDVRDKNGNYDLQENIGKNGTYLTEEGAQKQFDKKLADAYARKKEIEALIAEDNRQHGNPLLSYGASIGASNGRTAEQSDYRNKLATSLALVKQQIGALEAVKQYPTSSWGEDALKALDNTAFTAKTWDFGLTDFATMGQMERIKTKMDNKIPLSGSDKMLLKSKLGADAAAALEDEKMGNIYRWTKIAGQSLPFMADFFLTGGYGGITKGISRGALKFAAKRGMGKVSAAILKNTGIVAGDVIGSYAMAGTEQALKTGADIMQRHLGNLYQDEKGDYKFGTFDENGNLLHEGGESMGTALYKGLTSAMVENYTEKLFGHNYGIKKGAVNFMEKHGMNASAEFFKNIGKSGWYTNSKKWMGKFGINGFAEEVMEEEIGIPLHALLDGEGKVSDLLDAKQQLDIIGGMAISVGSMYAMGAGSRPVKGIYNRAQYYRFRNKVNVADSDAQNLMGDNWADIKDKIDNATNEQMGSVLADILRKRDTMTKEQINAAVNYGANLMKMRGYNIAKTAEMNAKEITNEPTTPEEQHQADIDNAYSEGHDADDADKHDIQIQQEDQMKTLAAALGISEQQLSAMSDEELESLTGQDDKLDQAIYDYQLSSARYQGVVDDAQDKVDLAAHQAEQRVDMYTDQSRGSVRNATIKASGGLEDYGVYIISGNIATHDDGSIDVSNSDDMILYYDPTTNSVEHADALMFAELGEELPADEVKAQAVADAKENAIKEVAGIIDGTIEVGSQFKVTGADGMEHTYEVLADYGDGTAAISIDGNVVENPYSLADLQQMKDLEDQKRLEAAKAEREQMEKERAAQQTQETEETQPSFDFNQILNDNGNVVLVDVLDKDGNTKYPDSRLFLIRDAGAKAKVVELKSDGTIVPHAVNKEDVATISSMSLDEYKQAMPESSMIEDNSGENIGEDSQLANLGLSKGSEIWMSGDGLGRPKENTLSRVVGIDEQGSIILEDKDGKKWSASFDYINNHRELPPLDENTNIVNEENNQSESNADENTPAPEQTPAMTLEDGTIVPMLEDGNPDFSKLTAEQTAELYDTQFGEDADSIVSGYVSDAKKALDKASNMTVKGKTFVEQKAAKDAKEKAIADAQAAYDSAIAIRDAYNERQLAKVEDTAEGRRELIEKARRKFARLKSAVKDDAEAVAQIYKETVGTLLHRLYDGTGIDVTDTIPLTAEEYVVSNLGAHSLNYEGTETSKGVKQETGLSREDFAKTQLLAAYGKGTTIDALVHSLWENRPSNLESLDTQDIRAALLDIINSGFKASEARNFVENIRIAQAENILEEQKRAQENAAYAEQHKAEPEAELKAKSDEKAELKAKSEAKLDNESDNKSNDLSNETDNEKTNDNINDNINTLTPEQQKAMEKGEKLGFPAFDKEGEPINQYVIELANWAKEQGLEIDPTSKSNSYADLFLMCKDGFGVSTLVPDEGENINQVVYFPDNVQDFDQLWKLQEEFNAGRDLKHSSNIDSEITEGATFYDADTAREFKEFVDKKVEKQNKVFGEQRPEEDLPFSAKENGKQQTNAERSADVEKNKVDDMKVVDSIVGQKTRKAFDRLAKMMGANIQWQYSDKLGNGWIQETTDADGNVHRTIFITLDSSITEGAQFIFGHEMTHQIKNLNPAAYNELTQLVLDTYGSDAFDKAVDETMQRYSDAGFSGRARDYYAEEVVADAVGEMIRDLNLAHTLAMKMSHPLLAAIHEILQKIKLAFFGTEYSDVTKNIIRSIEQAYVKTANGQVTNSETGEDVSFSLRQKPEPKKKGVGYKVFVLKDGKLYPPMVANPNGAATPVGVWLDADAAPIAGESKTGRPQVKQGGKGTQGGSGKLAYRPGWHLGVVPYAIQFNRKDAEGNKTLFPKNFVFAEVEYAADVDYQEEARQEGINPSGKYQHSLAGLKHLPTDGYYMYRTNPNPETDPWVITGAMKVNRILTRAEQAELVKNAGREPQQIQEGDIVTDDVVNSINQEIAAAPKFSLKTYHGTGANFDRFDTSHAYEGAGSETFGHGIYVTKSAKIGASYALKAKVKEIKTPKAFKAIKNGDNWFGRFIDNAVRSSFAKAKKETFNRMDELIKEDENIVNDETKPEWKQNAAQKELADFDKLKSLFEGLTEEDIPSLKRAKANRYEVEIPDDTGNNYLDWNKPMKKEQKKIVREGLEKLGVDVDRLVRNGYSLDKNFGDVYNGLLYYALNGTKFEERDSFVASSNFLSSLGFTGIKYYAGTIWGGAKKGDLNYVIFNEDDAKIVGNTKFSLKKVNDAFNQRLDELVKNPNQKDKILRLGRSSSFLKAGGIADADIELEFDKFVRKSGDKYKNNHPFNASDLKNLPMAIAEPIAVFKSTNANDHVVLTELQKDGKNFIVAIRAVEQHRKGGVVLEVNQITSLYPKEEKGIINWVNTGRISNVDKEKALHFIEALQPHAGTSITDEELKSAANIINSFETTKENGEKFSLKDEKTLAGVHNISEEKLLKAIKQGGLANPSVAVIDSSRQDHKAYGGISLILPSDKIAKRTGKNAGTWQGDAYTPTYPEVEKQMSNKGAEKSSSDVLSVPKEMQHEVRNGIDRWLNGGDANSGLKYLFLHEKGVAPEPKMIQPKFSDEAYNELKFITAGDFNIYGIGKADAQKVLDMYIEAKFDGDKDLYEEKTKAWLERNKSIVDAGTKGGMRYAIAKENVELYDEYGFNYKGVQTFVRDVEYDHRKSGVDTNATLNEVEDYIKTNNLTDEFNTWLEGKEKEYGIKEVIFDGFTPSGNRRYVPNTLENVSKLMKKQGRNGATGAAVSFQNFAARLMPSYGTLKDIRSKKGLLTSDREKFDKFREKWSNVFFELGMKCQPDATGTFDDYGLARLSEAAMTSDPQAYLKKEYNVDFSDEDTKRLKEMVKAIKEEHPAMYFETKFERPVRFDEFSAAVVPTTTKKEVKEALKNAGVSIFEYDEKSDADRKRAFNEAINSSDNIRFSLAGERGAAAADKAEERTFRMDNLSVAKDMEKNKKKAKAIKAATGWERGADGKWRYEMPDVVLRDPKEWVNKKTLTLSDIVEKPNDLFKEYPELFDAYPELKDMKILKGRAKSGGVFYNNAITLNLGDIREAIKYDMDTHYKLANNSLKKTLVHEIQHYIQDKEGFAQGGNNEMIIDKNALDAIAKLRAEKDAVAKEFYAMSPEEQQRRKYEINKRYNDLTKQIERLEKSSRIGYDGYNRLSGEVEARNVSSRLNMTPEERRKTLAESTEDVARKDQIFLGVGDVSFSLRDMADGKESGAADMAEDLKSLNTPDEVDDAIKTAIDDMPSGWQMANKKMIHIAQALGENRKAEIAGEEPKFSLKDGSLIKAGTYFSGGGLVEEGLKGIIDPVVAVEYDEKISGVYRNNFGQHIVTADVRDVDPKELVKQIDGEVEYFHASPVCKNYSQAKSNHTEVELDKETAASTAEFINAIKPKVVTIENVKGYKDSEAMKTITDALDANGYTWDADVYNAADYGGYTNRERLIVRAVRDGKLPAKPKKMARKNGWYEAVADIIPTLTEKKNGVAPWMDVRLKADGIEWRNIDKPLYVMGSAYADGKIPHAFADELLPTLRTKSGDVIVMPDGKVYRAMGRVLARVSGVSDDYKMPFSENLSHTIIGNGIPTQLTEHVIAPLLTGSDPKFSIRAYHGTGVSFDKFDLSHAFEGEGSETFGHGVYVTNSKKIGDNYAQRAKDRKGKLGFDYKIDMSADAGQMLSHYINKNQDVDKGLENARQDLKSALEMFPDDETLKELSAILQKNNNEIAEASNEAYLYDVDIPDDNGENYLGWNESQNFPLEKWYRLWEITHHGFNENEYFKDGGANYDKDRIERIIQMKLDSPENGMQKLPTLKGEELYHALEDFFDRERPLRGAKLASRALSEIGFVGIKYPAGLIHGGAEEGDYNYVIFDENNANIVGNTRFSLRYDKFEHDLNQWKKDNNLPKDAQRPTIPQRNAGESAVDFLRRVDEYRKQMALWKTAPTYEQHLLSDDTALGEFNRELQRGSVLKRIAFQDSMLAIRKAQEAIMKEVGVDRLNMAEDAYTAENRSHGKGKNEFEEYNNEFLQPLRKAYHQMKKILGDSYDNVRIYMMAKHGLERDAQMAFKKSLEADYEDVAQRSAAYKAYKGDMNRIINDSDLEFGRVDFTTWRQRDNALRVKYSPSYMDYRYDKNGIVYDYSGLSALFDGSDFEEAAHKLVKDIESKYVAETHNLWDATNAATKKVLRDGYKAGMMSKDTYQYVRDMYSHYIPLRGWDGTTADQVWDYIGGGKGAFNQTLKKAHGRTSIADDPIAYIENMAESGILLNNKNWVKQHLMLLAQNHPTSLLTLSKAWYVKSVDDNGNEEWIPATPQITSQMNSNQVKAAIDAFEKKMEQMAQTGDATQKRDGLNIAYPQTHSEEREHEVRVMKDGEEYVIYVNGDPQLAQAMNNTRAHRVREIQSGKLDRAAAWLGRKMAAAYTSLSPLFIPSNYFRDLTMTLASTAIREDGRYNYLLRKNLATSWNLGFMLRDYQNGKLREKVSNGNATPKEQMFYDFMMNGGETGFVSSLDVEDLKKKFKNDLKDLDRWKANPVKVGHTIMDSIEFLNRMIEDSNRFAVYMTSIQYGRSIDEAVNDAKDVTLNFNRKGTGEYGWQMIRNLYLFINPAVQSLQTLGALAKHHPFKFTAVTASWLASGVLVPIVNAALMSLLGGDDDKDKYWQFTKWDRRNNLIMWVPFTHEYVKIPLAQEFRAFYGIGDMIASKMMGGELAEESWSQYAEDLLGQVVDMFPLDPTGYDGNIAVSLMPNAIRPVFELAFNVDFTGKPLFKDTEYNKYDPNFTKAYVGTPDWLVRISRMVNSIGNDYPDVQQNSIDAFGDQRYNLNNPAVVDHVLSSYLGGAYTMGSQVLGVLTKSLNDPKEIKVADIPLFSKFVSNPDDRPVTKKQGDEFWNMKENHDRAANTLSKLKKQAKVDGDYSMLERFYGSEEYKQYKQDDVKVKNYEEDKKKERAEESGEESRPHKLNAEDIYKVHATPKDDFEDLKLKQLYTKLNGFKSAYDLLVDTAPSQSDAYYNINKAAIDAIDEISLDKQEISELKKGFLDDGKDAYNAEDMKQIRDLRKKILAVLEKANKVVVANQKAKAEK
jgi:site-specific DNA-cytosine methylase